jgi:hypothetical protein
MHQSPDMFLTGFIEQIAMWADENLFGHGLSHDEYESLAEKLADDLHEAAYQTLLDRPVR